MISEEFLVKFCHDSCKLEGNTLSMQECTLLLKDGLTPNAKKLREIFEQINTKKAFEYIEKKTKSDLNETLVKDIHEILMENIEQGGIYRSESVKITGSEWIPPCGDNMLNRVKIYFNDLKERNFEDIFEKASYAHCEFVKIHPFRDGNGRTARMILNYILMQNNILPVSISPEIRVKYYEALEKYDFTNDLNDFKNLLKEEY